MFPAGATPIPNPRGTAPGIAIKVGDCLLVAMPGVPNEMYHMYQTRVEPMLADLGMAGGVVLERKINCFGAGESALESRLLDLTRRGQVPEVGITVSDATISLRILARGATRQEALALVEPVEKTIRERLGFLVFGVENEQLHDVVVRLLIEKGKTLATAEGVTAGLVSARIAGVPGASECLTGGVITYGNSVLIDFLGVPSPLIEEKGVVSAEVAEFMARECRKRFQTDLAISTVGIAGPGGATPTKPVGLVYAGLAWDGGTRSQTFSWTGNRAEVQGRTVLLALNQLRLHLLGARS
jgi:nicotinamide-nucleotide amidase